MHLNALAHICPFLPNYVKFNDNTTNESIYETIENIAFTLLEGNSICIWKNRQGCTKFVKPLITEDGLCVTFNALNSDEMYTDE